MWLINCSNYSLEPNDIEGPDAKPYCILSHTWGDQEVTFVEIKDSLEIASRKKGFDKIRGICQIALELGYNYVWVDTCCIDKSSSAELTESINSMFYWYSKAERCIAYLCDLAPAALGSYHPTREELGRCRWFTRGWTLQELLAPAIVVFYDKAWNPRGTKADLCDFICDITDIDQDTLNWPGKLPSIPVARKMAWAANRESTRIEDKAYCLLGLFGIAMPLIYGERNRAFIRLQEMIAQKTNDMSLFAWRDVQNHGSRGQYSGLFAKDPSWFAECTTISRVYDPVIPNPSWIMTNGGMEITTALDWSDISLGYRLYLHCTYAGVDMTDQDEADPLVLSIWLRKTSSGYVRYKPNEVCLQAQSKIKFGHSSLIRVASSLTPRELSDVVRYYHPQSHLLNSAISFSWNVDSIEIQCAQNYHPQHLWDHQQRCFFTSSHSRFIGLVKLQISNAWGNPIWKPTCWILCGLMTPTNAELSEWAQTEPGLRPWVMVIKQNDDGSLGGLEGHTSGDLLDPFTLSTVGHRLRARFESEPPTSGDCVIRYGADRCLEVSASILSASEQLHRGRTIEVKITKSTIS
ncbi:putative vegetative incompatibility HET containing-domain protein [Cladorrhinum sp. PSN332]|nr:putative vegetative incompatibility HET containing-domain protein [Cladorrhinum sp. PSN332]